jgi:hypothetical protein
MTKLTKTQKRKLIRDLVTDITKQTVANIQARERAIADKNQKVYAAKLIGQIAKDYGFKSPPDEVKKNAIDKVKKAAADVQEKAKIQMAKHHKARVEAEKELFAALEI